MHARSLALQISTGEGESGWMRRVWSWRAGKGAGPGGGWERGELVGAISGSKFPRTREPARLLASYSTRPPSHPPSGDWSSGRIAQALVAETAKALAPGDVEGGKHRSKATLKESPAVFIQKQTQVSSPHLPSSMRAA